MSWIMICVLLLPLAVFCEDITTKNGAVYKDVQIFKQEADRLIITYPNGAATIYLEDCTEDIQKKYKYTRSGANNDSAPASTPGPASVSPAQAESRSLPGSESAARALPSIPAGSSAYPAALEIGGKPLVFEEKSTAGRTIRFPSDYRGKLVMLDFWATWCGPCRGELPNLTKLYAEFHPRGFEVLGVSLDNEASMKKLAQFTADNQMPWPQICDGNGWNAKLARQYGVQGIPACWLIDGNTGLIVAGQKDLRGAALRPTIERCLASLGKPSAPHPIADTAQGNTTPTAKPMPDNPLVSKARELAKAGKLVSATGFIALRKSPSPAPITLPPPSTQPLRAREIATRASQAYVRAGWIYRCAKCTRYHVKLAGGYAVARDTIVTAFHVMEPPDMIQQGEGYPVVARSNDEIIPIVSVLAADETLDAIILRVAAADLHPLALAIDDRVGDPVYCFSDPHDAPGYFSSGIINRFYTRPGGSADNPADQRINVSADWGPGSSGAAILDECANVIGHVTRIQSLFGAKKGIDPEAHPDETAPPIMTLHEAVPAKGILKLIDRMKADTAGSR